MNYQQMNDSNKGYQQTHFAQPQDNSQNYNYPNIESINNPNGSQLRDDIEIGQGNIQLVQQYQQVNYIHQQQNYQQQQQQPYMEHPYMGNANVDVNNQYMGQYNQNSQQFGIPQAPPPPPLLQNAMNSDNSMIQPIFKNEDYEVRSIEQIQECKHSNPSKHLYISSPQMCLSTIVIMFYILGVISLIVGLIILLIVLIIALGDNKGGGGGGGNCNADCNKLNCCAQCDCTNLCACFCRCSEICCWSYNPSPFYYSSYGYDYSYYRSRYYRKHHYHDYETNRATTNCVNSCCGFITDICCCTCCDSMSLGNPTNSCMINKVEVYCTECNSKLKEEYTGTNHVVPSLLLGIFGIIILVVSILLLQHYNVS